MVGSGLDTIRGQGALAAGKLLTVLEPVQGILVGGKFEPVGVGRSQAAGGRASGAPRYDDAPGYGTPNR